MLNSDEVQWLLDDLCTRLGFCLLPEVQTRLREAPPSLPEAFTDAVFREEGLDPDLADRNLYRQVREACRTAYRRAASQDA